MKKLRQLLAKFTAQPQTQAQPASQDNPEKGTEMLHQAINQLLREGKTTSEIHALALDYFDGLRRNLGGGAKPEQFDLTTGPDCSDPIYPPGEGPITQYD